MSTDYEDMRTLSFGNQSAFKNKPRKFITNYISTSKYNILTFLPFSLLFQFTRYANIYFLATAILNCFPIFSTLNPVSAIAPLVFVVLLSMMREGIEDYQRHKSDRELNSSSCQIYEGNEFVQRSWSDVTVGQILRIQAEEIICADVVVILTSLDTGQCFIETSSLDGEKNLKPKCSPAETQRLTLFQNPKLIQQLSGTITCQQPNPLLYSFEGSLVFDSNNQGLLLEEQQSINSASSSESGVRQSLANKKISLNQKNLLLRGSRLKNVKWVYGIVVYTGKDSKIMKNSDQGRQKESSIETMCNKYLLIVLLMQIGCCFFVSFMNIAQCSNRVSNMTDYISDNCSQQFFLQWASYFLLLNTMIPISLIVSLEFVKVGQAYFMEKDNELYVKHNNRSLKVFTCSINEDLGQVQYIFTDKTGTLTCNQMEFKMIVMGKVTYGDLNIIEDQQLNGAGAGAGGGAVGDISAQPFPKQEVNLRKRAPSFVDKRAGIEFCFFDEKLVNQMKDPDFPQPVLNIEITNPNNNNQVIYRINKQVDLINECLMLLATCHECVLEKDEQTGQQHYQGPSPDEIALVDAARHVGYQFNGMKLDKIVLSVQKEEVTVQLLHLFEFDSDRKRMSVIIRDGNVIKLYVKGADSIIRSRLNQQIEQPFWEEINRKLEFFSKKGLRTLCLAFRVLTEEEYCEFAQKMQNVVGKPNQEAEIKKLADQVEQNLFLLGSTAVEDRLQDRVPLTLRDLMRANIKIWMLTGDKMETAENIGRSCNLITEHMEVQHVRGNIEAVFDRLCEIDDFMKQKVADGWALIVEGEALARILAGEDSIIAFLQIIINCKSVICCRVTPKQKAQVVKLVKDRLKKVTLSIGDGANDVNMIQEAQIGVGIYGNEGMRAVQASDYAIGQFACLWKLVLYHGRLSYLRIAECILYFFYKNMIFTIPQFYFAFYCLYSGQSIFDDWYITLYNCLFTFWPVVIRAVFEEDVYYQTVKDQSGRFSQVRMSHKQVDESDLIRCYYPRLYYIGQKRTQFNLKKFMKWIFVGFLQGAVCFWIHLAVMGGQFSIDDGGYTSDIWLMSISLYTSIIIFWTCLTWVAFIFTSIGLYFVYIFISDNIKQVVVYQTADMLFSTTLFFFCVALSILSMFSLDLFLFSFKFTKDNLLNYFKRVTRTGELTNEQIMRQLDDKLSMELTRQRSLDYDKVLKKNVNAKSSNNPSALLASNSTQAQASHLMSSNKSTEKLMQNQKEQSISIVSAKSDANNSMNGHYVNMSIAEMKTDTAHKIVDIDL